MHPISLKLLDSRDILQPDHLIKEKVELDW
jgi:hypothetical protein